MGHSSSFFSISFEETVLTTKYFFPSLSITRLLAELGGSLGLWLGVGMTQLFISSVNVILVILLKMKHIPT